MPEPSQIQLETEDDPTPLVRALRADLARRLADPEFAKLTREVRGAVAVRQATTPEAATATIDDGEVRLRHGVGEAVKVVAVLDGGGHAEIPDDAPAESARLVAWLDRLLTRSTSWTEAAERFWSALEAQPGAPAGLLVVELESGERRRFGSDGRTIELCGSADDLVALLEGRTALIDEAYARRIFIRGSFPDLSVLSAAGFAVRTGAVDGDG